MTKPYTFLSIIQIESEPMKNLGMEAMIEKFAELKCRRKL